MLPGGHQLSLERVWRNQSADMIPLRIHAPGIPSATRLCIRCHAPDCWMSTARPASDVLQVLMRARTSTLEGSRRFRPPLFLRSRASSQTHTSRSHERCGGAPESDSQASLDRALLAREDTVGWWMPSSSAALHCVCSRSRRRTRRSPSGNHPTRVSGISFVLTTRASIPI
jgi:hypothetical protein